MPIPHSPPKSRQCPSEMDLPDRPWTKRQIHDLRKAIVQGGDSINGLNYATDVASWYHRILNHIVTEITDIIFSDSTMRNIDISFRVKTIDTLRDKLIRSPYLQLPRIRDIMGVRLTAPMNLQEQDQLVHDLTSAMPVFTISDTRNAPHSGYRAVHVILKCHAGTFCEIQVRTSLQDAWANCYELAGDIFGRDIRYDGNARIEDYGLVKQLRRLSDTVRQIEHIIDISSNTDAGSQLTEATVAEIFGYRSVLERLRDLLEGDRL